MATLFTSGRFQAIDASGVIPLAVLKTYAAGTLTPLATYTDQTEATPNPTTITCDANGQANVWLGSSSYRFRLFKADGTTLVYDTDNVVASAAVTVADLGSTSDAAKGAALVGYKSPLAGAVAETLYVVAQRTVNLFDFLTDAQRTSWSAGNLAQDCTTGLQAFFDACSSDTAFGAPEGIMPPGKGKITSNLRCKKKYIRITGAGKWQTWIDYSGVAGGCIVADAIPLFAPQFRDFGINGNSTSGHAIDTSAVTDQVYDGVMSDLYISAGKNALFIPAVFSFNFDRIVALSATDHVFRIAMGNTTSMRGCYAVSMPAGKCGYRLRGSIRLYECNGVDSGGIWGIFGNRLAATDGWQGDFAFEDFPSVDMQGCNVEAFGVAGIILHNGHRSFNFMGGKIDRSVFSTDYHGVIYAPNQGQTGSTPIRLEPGIFLPGSGQAKGGTFALGAWTAGALTNAQLYGGPSVYFEDSSEQVSAGLIAYSFVAKSYSSGVAALVPLITRLSTSDVNGDTAASFSALTMRRLSVQMLRYKVPATLTPVGAGQNIDVTGATKVLVSPAAAASITTATFTATSGAGLDFGRNGDLLIEAGNANLTINHTALGGAVNTFVMAAGANLAVGSGRVVRFCRSDTTSQWIQV